jgi:hypothetical protein
MVERETTYTLPGGQTFVITGRWYLASCDGCGWIGSSEHCGTDSWGDDSDVYCPKCERSGCDMGRVAATATECVVSTPSHV